MVVYGAILSEVINVVKSRVSGVNDIREDTSFTGDLALDSLQVMELVGEFEDYFHIEISLESLFQIETVADVARLLVAAPTTHHME